ncbi:hypothetical protein B0H17DRAFT_1135434 [Mycena rosella]|uniref:Uncharacterized protein n=1 Tax=Mycena rosella TaxID=1033263 RepID=A0AAD7DDU7_MYCRO|nr:hypothetical protein B0H17DRAFT_1135434 [Mycena rosella]
MTTYWYRTIRKLGRSACAPRHTDRSEPQMPNPCRGAFFVSPGTADTQASDLLSFLKDAMVIDLSAHHDLKSQGFSTSRLHALAIWGPAAARDALTRLLKAREGLGAIWAASGSGSDSPCKYRAAPPTLLSFLRNVMGFDLSAPRAAKCPEVRFVVLERHRAQMATRHDPGAPGPTLEARRGGGGRHRRDDAAGGFSPEVRDAQARRGAIALMLFRMFWFVIIS